MFVLTSTEKAIENNSSPYLGVMLFMGLIAIIVVSIIIFVKR